MREIVNIHVGQAGVRFGEAFWELLCLEHAVAADGTLNSCAETVAKTITPPPDCYFYNVNSKYFPRALFIDTDPDAIDTLTKSRHRALFKPEFLISEKESAANNFARGFHSAGRRLDETLDRIRRVVESCEHFQGFSFSRSIAGGTGSGLSASLYQHLDADYQNKNQLELAIFPSPNVSSTPLEPYNAVLSTHSTLPNVNCSFVVDNEAVYERLKENVSKFDDKNHTSLNQLIAQAVSSTSLSVRSSSEINVDINEFSTNLVPFQRLHFPMLSYSPIVGKRKDEFHLPPSTDTITESLFTNRASFVSCDLAQGRFISCCLLYRGSTQLQNVEKTIAKFKKLRKLKLVDWCPTTFKIGVNQTPPVFHSDSVFECQVPTAVCMLASNTAVKTVFGRMTHKFRLMHSKRAFVHWYVGEGMEESELQDAYDDVKLLEQEYQQQEDEAFNDSISSNTDGI